MTLFNDLLNLHQNSTILFLIRPIAAVLRKFKLHFPFYKNLSRDLAQLYGEAKKDHKSLGPIVSDLVKTIKERVKSLPCLTLANPAWPKIVERIASNIGTYYNNFWDKLMKKDPQTKSIYGQELLDLITKTVHDYKTIPNKGIMTDDSTSVKHMARKISNHDEGEQNEMIMRYLEEVKKKILLNISHYAKSDSSMRSETSEDMHEAQQYEEESPIG
ncbi:hypothetical protein H5410_019582 [Solanum commersonii]|uniref:Uncharacterized protein n=1 Tax=Solanum commersonii TaxID=4109 RepID=A0A9J5Z7T2_SOLCO|nr:hypothetical protein H5410_019582 [Solanum commersonii]